MLLSDLSLQITAIGIRQELRRIHEENKRGRCRPVGGFIADLRCIQNFKALVCPKRRRMGFHCLLKQSIQNPSPDQALRVFSNFFDTREQAIKIFSGMCREDVNRRVAEKEEVCPNLTDNYAGKIPDAARGLNQVKLIDDDYARLVGLLNEACNLFVLGGNSVYCI